MLTRCTTHLGHIKHKNQFVVPYGGISECILVLSGVLSGTFSLRLIVRHKRGWEINATVTNRLSGTNFKCQQPRLLLLPLKRIGWAFPTVCHSLGCLSQQWQWPGGAGRSDSPPSLLSSSTSILVSSLSTVPFSLQSLKLHGCPLDSGSVLFRWEVFSSCYMLPLEGSVGFLFDCSNSLKLDWFIDCNPAPLEGYGYKVNMLWLKTDFEDLKGLKGPVWKKGLMVVFILVVA